MTIRKLREQMQRGRSIYELPLRVTFYARVSTEKLEQQGSLEHQIQYYTELIQKNPNWTYVEGYVDEGASGTTTYKRESFLRMIDDAEHGLFDFIITKEISRFSRNTLDSIQYTQALLNADVGVLFQNDNLNTLDSDSEFRLVVMAGVAQDEVRKLSERLKFGFRQSIKNGRVLGNDRLWGYDKKDCKLTIVPEQAEGVRLIFQLYATGEYGIRRLSQALTAKGFTSARGNDFNLGTIRHILTNPKYKGWYCGNKTRSLDYRTKKKAHLAQEEWVMYPDPNIPAIVSEELWNRANAIFQMRSDRAKACGAGYQSKYPYSGKIICGEHGTSCHRQAFKTVKGETEFWRCRIYRTGGKAKCALPALKTCELDRILSNLFKTLVTHQSDIVKLVMDSLHDTVRRLDNAPQMERIATQIRQLDEKKEKLLALSIANAITMQEFKKRNNRFNEQIYGLEQQIISIRKQANKRAELHPEKLEYALWEELRFSNGVSSDLVGTILDHIVIRPESTDTHIYLDIYCRLGQTASVHFSRKEAAFCGSPS